MKILSTWSETNCEVTLMFTSPPLLIVDFVCPSYTWKLPMISLFNLEKITICFSFEVGMVDFLQFIDEHIDAYHLK